MNHLDTMYGMDDQREHETEGRQGLACGVDGGGRCLEPSRVR